MTNYQQPISALRQICWYFQYYRAARQSGNYRVYLFYDHRGIPIGYGALRLKGIRLYLTECVEPAYRGHGYGKIILAALIEIAREEKRDLLAEIWASNERSIAMHKEAGFELIETRKHNDGMLHIYILKVNPTYDR